MCDEGFAEINADVGYCILCGGDDKICGYHPYNWCEHEVCLECLDDPDVWVSGDLEYMCTPCFIDRDDSEENRDAECPICSVNYAASGISEEDHWTISHEFIEYADEGVRDLSSLN